MKNKVSITSFQATNNKSSINMLLSILPLIFCSADTIWLRDGASGGISTEAPLNYLSNKTNLASFEVF
jgi:hypothetical protein